MATEAHWQELERYSQGNPISQALLELRDRIAEVEKYLGTVVLEAQDRIAALEAWGHQHSGPNYVPWPKAEKAQPQEATTETQVKTGDATRTAIETWWQKLPVSEKYSLWTRFSGSKASE